MPRPALLVALTALPLSAALGQAPGPLPRQEETPIVTVPPTTPGGSIGTVRGRSAAGPGSASSPPSPQPATERAGDARTGSVVLHKGMAILPYRDDYEQEKLPQVIDRLYDRLAGLGVNAVNISWPLFQESHTASEIRRGDRTPPDEDLRLFFRKAQDRGWWVVFRPYLEESNFHVENQIWRGTLAPADRDAWFASYTRLLLDYARIAEQTRADTFIIGAEFNSLDGDPRWSDIIRQVRAVYAGQITYAANWDHVEQVPFWDQLDVVGVDSFYPLDVPADDVSVESVVRAWQPWVEQVRRIKARYGKPVVFLELGVTAQRGALREPWTWDTQTPVDLETQRIFYEATCRVVKPLLQGMYWWVAYTWIEPADPLNDREHTPFGKPAEQEIRRCYAGDGPAAASDRRRLVRGGQQSSPRN